MAADQATQHSIFFIASVLITLGVAGSLAAATGGLGDAVKLAGRTSADRYGTDFVVINDPANPTANTSNSTLTIYVKNVGQRELAASEFSFLLDGELLTISASRLISDSRWTAQETAEFTLSTTLSVDDHSLLVVGPHGRKDVFEFTWSG